MRPFTIKLAFVLALALGGCACDHGRDARELAQGARIVADLGEAAAVGSLSPEGRAELGATAAELERYADAFELDATAGQ